MTHQIITAQGATAPVTTQAPDTGVAVGHYIAGTDVTSGRRSAGRVDAIVPPLKYSGQYGNRYRITDGRGRTHYVDEPTALAPVEAAGIATAIALLVDGADAQDVAGAATTAAALAGAGARVAATIGEAARAMAIRHHESAGDLLAA